MTELTTNRVLVLARDLMFVSRITATGQAAGILIQVIRDPLKLGTAPGRLLIVDLNLDGAIEAAAEWRKGGGPTLGFVAHVDTDTINRAKAAGIDQVMTRGQFARDLAKLLTPPGNPGVVKPSEN